MHFAGFEDIKNNAKLRLMGTERSRHFMVNKPVTGVYSLDDPTNSAEDTSMLTALNTIAKNVDSDSGLAVPRGKNTICVVICRNDCDPGGTLRCSTHPPTQPF